jgi:MFS transporter, MCT family, solute carrier family 16 (monocarboxylic acid transporters), member 10
MMVSLCTEYWQFFLAQGLGLGLAFGMCFNLAVALPTHYFHRRRAFALGIQASGSSVGGTVLPIMVSKLVRRYHPLSEHTPKTY